MRCVLCVLCMCVYVRARVCAVRAVLVHGVLCHNIERGVYARGLRYCVTHHALSLAHRYESHPRTHAPTDPLTTRRSLFSSAYTHNLRSGKH